MFRILSKIFQKRIKPFSLLFSAIGMCLGITLVFVSIQLYVHLVKPTQSEMGKSDYLILNKDISIGNTLFNSKAVFSSEDKADLSKQPFAAGIAEFVPNQYSVKAYAGGGIPFMTDLFFESVPKDYIDNCPYNFTWEEGDDFLPIIVSEDFINLYNYTFASINGLPQVSPSTVKAVPLKIVLKGPDNTPITMSGRIVGYTERIASVLVPLSFMDWANKEVGKQANRPASSRLIIKVNKEYASNMEQYVESKGYSVNSEKLFQNKINGYVTILTNVLVGIGGLFILFSFIIVLQNFALLISDSKQDMNLLLQLGYKVGAITKFLFSILSLYIFLILSFSVIVYWVAISLLSDLLIARNMAQLEAFSSEIFITIGLLAILLLTSGLLSIRLGVKRNQ